MKRVAAMTICASLLIHGGAFAHQGEKHQGKHKEDAQMDRLHRMMPMYAQAQAKINEALEKGDAAAVETGTTKILATCSRFEESKTTQEPQGACNLQENSFRF